MTPNGRCEDTAAVAATCAAAATAPFSGASDLGNIFLGGVEVRRWSLAPFWLSLRPFGPMSTGTVPPMGTAATTAGAGTARGTGGLISFTGAAGARAAPIGCWSTEAERFLIWM